MSKSKVLLYVIIISSLVFFVLAIIYYYLGYFLANKRSDSGVYVGSGAAGYLNKVSTGSQPQYQKVEGDEYKVEVVLEKLYVPWSITFTSNDRMIFTERNGNLNSFDKAGKKVIHRFTEVKEDGEEGLMAITLDPKYDLNKHLYICLAYPSGSAYKDKVVRYKDNITSISEPFTIIDNIPSAMFHAGCELKFGPDDKLYISTGDATQKDLAQDTKSLAGKILRVNSDGSIPEDNPYKNSPVWSYGHRNPQGFDWYEGSNTLYSVEHGPSGSDGPGGGDEINVIKKGANYGWPLVSHNKTKEGTIAPKLVFTPAIAPSSMLFYKIPEQIDTDDIAQFVDKRNFFVEFKSNFLFAALKGEGIYRLVVDNNDPERILFYQKLPNIDVGRVREIIEGPDGAIYISTSNRDGRGSLNPDDDKIYRISRVLNLNKYSTKEEKFE